MFKNLDGDTVATSTFFETLGSHFPSSVWSKPHLLSPHGIWDVLGTKGLFFFFFASWWWHGSLELAVMQEPGKVSPLGWLLVTIHQKEMFLKRKKWCIIYYLFFNRQTTASAEYWWCWIKWDNHMKFPEKVKRAEHWWIWSKTHRNRKEIKDFRYRLGQVVISGYKKEEGLPIFLLLFYPWNKRKCICWVFRWEGWRIKN